MTMDGYVIDTNVPIVANDRSEQADADCLLACIKRLNDVYKHGIVVLDDGMRILDEYMNNLSLSGQPGLGDAFMKWVWTVQADTSRCERVQLTRRRESSHPDDFNEFPHHRDLEHFDWSDRKFVAVALASKNSPTILNATDSDWADHHPALQNAGVHIEYLCPQHVRPRE